MPWSRHPYHSSLLSLLTTTWLLLTSHESMIFFLQDLAFAPFRPWDETEWKPNRTLLSPRESSPMTPPAGGEVCCKISPGPSQDKAYKFTGKTQLLMFGAGKGMFSMLPADHGPMPIISTYSRSFWAMGYSRGHYKKRICKKYYWGANTLNGWLKVGSF